MSAAPQYRFLAVNMSNGALLGEVPFSSASWTDTLNRSGSFTGTIDMDSAVGFEVLLDLGKNLLVVERNRRILWAGVVWSVRKSGTLEEPSLEFGATSLWDYWRRRFVTSTRDFGSGGKSLFSLFQIASGLLSDAPLSVGGVPVTVASQGVWGKNHSRIYYGHEAKEIAEAVEQLCEVGAGMDFDVVSAWDQSVGTGGTPKLQHTITFTPGARGYFREHLPLVLGQNIRSYDWSLDGHSMANRVIAYGAGEEAAKLTLSVSGPTRDRRFAYPGINLGAAFPAGYPYLDHIVSDQDISVIGTLVDKAEEEHTRRATPTLLVRSIVPSNEQDYIGSIRPGDTLPLSVSDGLIQVHGTCRVVEFSTEVDPDANETISLTTEVTL